MSMRYTTELGSVVVDTKVIAQMAGLSAVELYGIVGMAMVSLKDGIVKMLSRSALTKGVNVTVEDNELCIDFHIIIEYGVNIRAVTENLISTVKYKLETFSGMKVKRINVFVEGVRVDE